MAKLASRSNRVALFFFTAQIALISSYLGVKFGSQYKMNELLFELPPRQATRVAFRQVLGLQSTYSQAQQDLWIVLSVAPGKRDGFYVDVGSGDGERISNTNLLDQLGWKGICIDPFPRNMQRRTCQVFQQAVFSEGGKKVSFRAAGDLGGITQNLTRFKDRTSTAPIVELRTATLDEILDKAQAPRHIDYMSIDVEGAEFEALRGLSLDKHVWLRASRCRYCARW